MLLKLPEIPDGIFCANDYTAIVGIQVIKTDLIVRDSTKRQPVKAEN